MKRLILIAIATGCSAPAKPPAEARVPPAAAPGKLLPPAAFDGVGDRAARSRAMFGEIARVLTSPRCVNCHPDDDSPRQRDGHEMHDPPVIRGLADRGVPAMQCTTCHQDANVELSRVPGAPDWHLAPKGMAWRGKTTAQICEQIKDVQRNGGRSLTLIQKHVAKDPLVGWGWAPGADRTPAPGTQRELGELVQAWIDSGAECPP